MCGISGIITFTGEKVTEMQLKYLNTTLNHRGPDHNGIYVDTSYHLGLGHTRTSIFDTSTLGHQPMSYQNKRYWITFNGEIFNFLEIRNELKSLGHRFVSETDTEVILAAYTQWGENCQNKFNGDWAFAIWDTKKKNLFLSRDRFGSKPLYYFYNHKYFIFASELKAFMSLKKKIRPNFDEGILLWMGKNYGSINTFLKNILLLPSGCQININEKNNFYLKKWWRTCDHLIKVSKNYQDQVEDFKQIFIESCKIRIRSDVPIASCLSGGLDSSSVVSTISEIVNNKSNIERYNQKNQDIFFCEFSNDLNSEKSFANSVLEKYKNLKFNEVIIDSNNISPDLIEESQFYNEWIDADCVQLSMLYNKMKNKNIRVSLDGNAADELLGGYWEDPIEAMKDEVNLFSNNNRFNDLKLILKELSDNKSYQSKYKIIIRKYLGNKKYSKLATLYENFKVGKYYNNNKYDLINKSKLTFPEEDDIKNFDFFNKHLYRQFHYYNTPYLLLKWDKLSMSHGVLSRAPFLDVNLVKYLFSLPSTSKIGGGFTKKILRDSMKKVVHEKILARKDKRGFTSPAQWYGKNMREYIFDKINSAEFLQCNFFNGRKLKEDYENNKIFKTNNSSKIILKYIQIINLINSFKKVKYDQSA